MIIALTPPITHFAMFQYDNMKGVTIYNCNMSYNDGLVQWRSLKYFLDVIEWWMF